MNFSQFVQAARISGADARLTRHRPLAGKVFAITGKLDDGVSRTDWASLITLWGGSVSNIADYRVNALLAVDPDRRTAKQQTARRYGVPVLSEHDFVEHWLVPAVDTAYLAERAFLGADDDDVILNRISPLSDLGA